MGTRLGGWLERLLVQVLVPEVGAGREEVVRARGKRHRKGQREEQHTDATKERRREQPEKKATQKERKQKGETKRGKTKGKTTPTQRRRERGKHGATQWQDQGARQKQLEQQDEKVPRADGKKGKAKSVKRDKGGKTCQNGKGNKG